MIQKITSILLAFLMQLSALFGFGGGKDAVPADEFDSVYNNDSVVNVIVELETPPLLEGITGLKDRDALVDNIETNEDYSKIVKEQSAARKKIENKFSLADFTNSYSYSFIANGFSLAIPYRFVESIKKLPGIKNVTISNTYEAPTAEEEEALGNFYRNHDKFTGIEEAHRQGYTGKGTVIAILDTGFELGHEAFDFEVEDPTYSKRDITLKSAFGFLNTIVPMYSAHYISSKIPYRWDYSEVNKGVQNPNSDHGTHVAGIAGGKSSRMTGVAPDAQFLLMKVFGDEEGSSAQEHVTLAALDDCVKLKADVINMSLGSPCGQEPDDIFEELVYARLRRAGINVCCSAGNERSLSYFDAVGGDAMNAELFDYATVGSPSSFSLCMSVAASAINSNSGVKPDVISRPGIGSIEISGYSSWGPTEDLRLKPEITTPGSNILSSVPGNDYASFNGTSMAAPYYAGSACLMRQFVKEHYAGMDSKKISEFVNCLTMSTATIFKAYNDKNPYSPRRQGAGFINLEGAISTPAYLTQADGKSRPKIELGEQHGNTLDLSFKVHNTSDSTVRYRLHELVMADNYRKVGDHYNNLITSRLLNDLEYIVTDNSGIDDDRIVTVAPGKSENVKLTVKLQKRFIDEYETAFKNGYFVDGFVVLEDVDNENPTLSIPFMAFFGDWQKDMLFDNSIYDENPPYLNGQWGLAVSDGSTYYPLGVNIFEEGNQTGIDTKYCAYSKHAMGMEKPYITVSIGLLRNAKRIDYNLFTSSGIFRYCGSTLLEYGRKTVTASRANHGVLWGGKSGLVSGNSYVYKVSTRPLNYDGKRRTIEFPFVVDNHAPEIAGYTYSVVDGNNMLTLKISDNHYVMGFQLFTPDDKSIGKVSFKDVQAENGVYTYTVNVSELAPKLSSDALKELKVYTIDYAYNETHGIVSLSGSDVAPTTVPRAAVQYAPHYVFNKQSVAVDLTPEESAGNSNPFAALLERLGR